MAPIQVACQKDAKNYEADNNNNDDLMDLCTHVNLVGSTHSKLPLLQTFEG